MKWKSRSARLLNASVIVLLAITSSVLASACSDTSGPMEWVADRGGAGRVYEQRSESECPWNGLTLLVVDSGVLRDPSSATPGAAVFIRDTDGRLSPPIVSGRFETIAAPPATASFAGFRNGRRELWVMPDSEQTGVFIVNGAKVEHWPVLKSGCA